MRCWYTRWQLSSALDRGELASRMSRGHAGRCASCQAHGQALATLDAELAREIHTATPPPPVARRARVPWLIAGPLIAGTAAVVLAVTASGPQPPAPPEEPLQALQTLVRVRGLAEQFSRAFATTTPLETELDNLLHDGRRGLDEVLATGGLRLQ